MSSAAIVEIKCKKCGEVFLPYGETPYIVPAIGTYKCPNCGYDNEVIWDEQIAREFAREKLGLNKKLNEKLKAIELENKEIKMELVSLKKELDELKSRIGKLTPETRKQIVDDITTIIIQQTKKKPSTFEPV